MLERIQREGGVVVAEKLARIRVSAITVHRDLEQLAAEGLVERVHGGARALAPPARLGAADRDRVVAARGQASGKEAIAERAAELVTPGRRSSSTRRPARWRWPGA